MKNIKKLAYTTLFAVVFFSCSRDNDDINPEDTTNNTPTGEIIFDPEDSPTYYDQDENCDLSPNVIGNCCDVDGRLLVRPNFCYKYTYVGKYSNLPGFTMDWEVSSGSLTIVQGQHTQEVIIKIGSDFTGGVITGKGNGIDCHDSIYISKL